MALIKCPECKKDISSKATKCVYCGYELKSTDNNLTLDEKNVITLLKFASASRVLFIVFAFISLISATENALMLLVTFASVVLSIIYPAFIENKALVLKNLYEINRKEK